MDDTTVELVAAALWRDEVVDSGAPKSVAANRTNIAFEFEADVARNKWLKAARAAIAALPTD